MTDSRTHEPEKPQGILAMVELNNAIADFRVQEKAAQEEEERLFWEAILDLRR